MLLKLSIPVPVDKFCSYKEMDFTANHTKSYINEVKKLPTLDLNWFIPGPDSVGVSKLKHGVHTTHILGKFSSVPTHGGLQHAFFTDTVMFLKLVKSARMTWRKRLWEVGGIYSYPINKHFLYVSMSICSLCSSATPWFHFWSLPTLTKPHTQCHVGHFSHTASQAQPLIFAKSRSPLSAYFWVSNLFQKLGIHSFPIQPSASLSPLLIEPQHSLLLFKPNSSSLPWMWKTGGFLPLCISLTDIWRLLSSPLLPNNVFFPLNLPCHSYSLHSTQFLDHWPLAWLSSEFPSMGLLLSWSSVRKTRYIS